MDWDTLAGIGIGIAALGVLGYLAYSEMNSFKERNNTPYPFDDGFTESEFAKLVHKCSKEFRRITEVKVNRTLVQCEVRSVSGCSTWDFMIDFNDYGQLSGSYWILGGNSDSSLPRSFARRILDCLDELKQSIYESQRLSSKSPTSSTVSTMLDPSLVRGKTLSEVLYMLQSRGFQHFEFAHISDWQSDAPHKDYDVMSVRMEVNSSFSDYREFAEKANVKILFYLKGD